MMECESQPATNIKVSNPKALASNGFIGTSSHWTFTINSSFKTLEPNTYSVKRSYYQFIELEHQLRNKYAGIILPPLLPEKLEVDSKNKLALKRASDLERYLITLTKIARVANSELLFQFLTNSSSRYVPLSNVRNEMIITNVASSSLEALLIVYESSSELFQNILDSTTTSRNTISNTQMEDFFTTYNNEKKRLDVLEQAIPKLKNTTACFHETNVLCNTYRSEIQRIVQLSYLSHISSKGEDHYISLFDTVSSGLLKYTYNVNKVIELIQQMIQSFHYSTLQSTNILIAFQDYRVKRFLKSIAYKRKNHCNSSYELIDMEHSKENQKLDKEAPMKKKSSYELIHQKDMLENESFVETTNLGTMISSEIDQVNLHRRMEWIKALETISNGMKQHYSENIKIWKDCLKEAKDLCT